MYLPGKAFERSKEFVKGKTYIVSEDLIPASLVEDPTYATKIDQINSSPYYFLVRRQYYMPNPIFIAPGETKSYSVEMDYSFSSTSINEIKQTVSWGIEASISAEYEGATASLGAQYQNSTEYLQSTEQSNSESYKIKRSAELKSPASIDFTVVVWQLMNEYTLYDTNGNVVPSADWDCEETFYQKSYPELPFEIVN